jgi:hypothetical protein
VTSVDPEDPLSYAFAALASELRSLSKKEPNPTIKAQAIALAPFAHELSAPRARTLRMSLLNATWPNPLFPLDGQRVAATVAMALQLPYPKAWALLLPGLVDIARDRPLMSDLQLMVRDVNDHVYLPVA